MPGVDRRRLGARAGVCTCDVGRGVGLGVGARCIVYDNRGGPRPVQAPLRDGQGTIGTDQHTLRSDGLIELFR